MKTAIVNAHNLHVMNLALDFSFFLNHDGFYREQLVDAAMIHDQGKLFIPDEILMKPERLTPDEWLVMKTHVDHSVQYAVRKNFSKCVVRFIQDHHENFDGSGYPNGLKGHEISEGGRILRVCDVFAALTESEEIRPYRRPLPVSHALQVMRRESQWFDLIIFEQFESHIKSLYSLSTFKRKLVAIV